MKVCPNCGLHVADDTVFCGNCGTLVPEPGAPRPPQGEPAPSTPPVSNPSRPGGGFCPNCGAPQPAGSTFCSNCGVRMDAASQDREGQETPRKERKSGGHVVRNVIIGVVAAAVVAAGGFGVFKLIGSLRGDSGKGSSVGMFASEEEQFVGYQKDLLNNRVFSHMEGAVDSVSKGFSTDLTVRIGVEGGDDLPKDALDALADSSIVLRLDMGQDGLLAEGEMVLLGSPVISGLVTYEEGIYGLYLPLVDSNYYTIDLLRFLEENDVDEDLPLAMRSMLTDVDTAALVRSGKDWAALGQNYLNVLLSVVNKENLTVEKNAAFRYSQLEGSGKGTVFTFSPRAEDIENMVLEMARLVEKDRDLRRLLRESYDDIALLAYSDASGEMLDEDELDEAIEEWISETVEQMEDEAEAFGEMVEELDITWTLCMEGREIRRIAIEWQVDDEDYTIAYESRGDQNKDFTEVFFLQDEDSFAGIRSSYTKKDKTYTGEVTLLEKNMGYGTGYGDGDEDITEILRLEYTADTGEISTLGLPCGRYVMTAPQYSYVTGEIEDVDVIFEVRPVDDGSFDHVLRFERETLEHLDGAANFDAIELIVNATDRCSAKWPGASPVDITDYSMEELEELFEGMAEDVERLMNETLQSLAGTLGAGGAAAG